MTQLELLDLSSNTLEGRMPQELVQLKFLEVLNVSYNNLTGPIPQGKQFKTFTNNSYMGNSALCGDPLSKKCGKPDVSKPPTVSYEQDTEPDFPSGVDWVVILSGLDSRSGEGDKNSSEVAGRSISCIFTINIDEPVEHYLLRTLCSRQSH
ncbi:receptor-like protein 12 [Tanacetum coccineum]